MSEAFDFNKALAALQNSQDLTGKDGILTPLIKQLTEAALNPEGVFASSSPRSLQFRVVLKT